MTGIITTWNEWLNMKQQGWTTAWIEVDDLGRVSLGAVPPEGTESAPDPCPEPERLQEPLPLPAVLRPDKPPAPVVRARPKGLPERTPEKSMLTRRLELLQSEGWRHLGKPATIRLANGLRVDLVIERSGTYRLLLARCGVEPSITELSTVLTHWPAPVPDVVPEAFVHGEWRCLRVMW